MSAVCALFELPVETRTPGSGPNPPLELRRLGFSGWALHRRSDLYRDMVRLGLYGGNRAGYIHHFDFNLPRRRANDRLAVWLHANPAYRRLPDITPDDGSVQFVHLVQKNTMEWTHHFVAVQSHCQIDVMWTFALTGYSSRAVQNGIMYPAMMSFAAK